MIIRMWHGWTALEHADAYQELLEGEVLPGIEERVTGCEGVQVLRRDEGDRVEFITLMLWRSMDAIRSWLGDDYERAYVPPEARRLLSAYDERSAHYDLALSVGWKVGRGDGTTTDPL